MKAAVWHARRDIRVQEFPDPGDPAPDEVRLRVAWCGICGTDLEEYLHGPLFIPVKEPNPLTRVKAPLVMGHEFVGRVEEVGQAVDDLRPGDHVAVDTLIHCGECTFCRRHQVNLCDQLAIMGLSTHGGLAEFVNAPRYMCFKYPTTLADPHAALAEPASVAVHATRKGRLEAGETVAIVGAGTIGLLNLQVALAMGAGRVFVVEPEPRRRQLAMDLGATSSIDPLAEDAVLAVRRITRGIGVDIAFEDAGSTQAMAMVPDLVRKAGRAVFVGLHDEPVPMQMVSVVCGEKELIGSFSHVYDEDFSTAVEMLSTGSIVSEPLITAQIGLDDLVPHGLEELACGKARHLKILVSPGM